MNRLRKLRVIFATLFTVVATLLFVDFTGSIHQWFGWVARVQFIPALLALNVVAIVALVILTLLFGRLYCSVICPLGVFQDVVSRLALMSNKKRKYSFSPARSIVRYGVLALFIIAFVAGVGSFVALLEPYSAFGRMASNLAAPIYKLGNNLLAYFAERVDSYAFYTTEIIVMGVGTFVVAAVTFIIVGGLAWRKGRSYCNTICPVGTLLGVISKFSIFKITIDHEKCNGCQKCVRSCKSSCITTKEREIDYSRCVTCFDCIDSCNKGAITYTPRFKKTEEPKTDSKGVDSSKRNMLAISTTLLATSALKAEEKYLDGGLAIIENKKVIDRDCRIVPPGAKSIRNFERHCTGCQLCVSVCPNQVLRPSTGLMNFMQPEMSFERGYCRPECTKCSEVCPVGAIEKVDTVEKSSTQIGHAVWIMQNCLVVTDEVSCGHCATHCPTAAITMIESGNHTIPSIDISRCIGCGACENLCPTRPFSAIYVEGHTMHKSI